MEGLIFIAFLAFIALVFFKPNNVANFDPDKKGLDKDGNYDIPEALRIKWDGQNNASSSSTLRSRNTMTPTQRGRETMANQAQKTNARMTASTLQSIAKQKLQSKHSNARNTAQTKEYERSGDGVPLDNNPNRREDWGRQGGMSGGWFTPFLISALVAGGIAALFAST